MKKIITISSTMFWYGSSYRSESPVKKEPTTNDKMFMPIEGELYAIYGDELSEKSDDAQNCVEFQTGESSIRGRRGNNEDEWISVKNEDFQLIGALDGHGGKAASLYFKTEYERILTEIFKENPGIKSRDAISKACEQIEKYICDKYMSTGTTLAAVMLRNNRAIIHHIGDSRVIIYTKDGRIIESIDHKPNLHCEYTKGSYVSNNIYRMSSGLAMSRAIGDRDYKQTDKALNAKPDFQSVLLSEIKWIFCATDGVFDKITSKEVIDIIDTFCYKDINPSSEYSETVNEAIKIYQKNQSKDADQEVDANKQDEGNTQGQKTNNIFESITNVLTDLAYRRDSEDNCTAIFTAIEDYLSYPPVNFNALQITSINTSFDDFYKTFPFPRLLAKFDDNFIVLDNSTYTRMLIQCKYPTSLITDIFVPKDKSAEITYSCYQQLKPATFQQIFLTQQFTKSTLQKSLQIYIRQFSNQRTLEDQRDFTLMFPRFSITVDADNIDQLLKKMSEFEDPPLVQFYSYQQQQSTKQKLSIKEESSTNEECEEESGSDSSSQY